MSDTTNIHFLIAQVSTKFFGIYYSQVSGGSEFYFQTQMNLGRLRIDDCTDLHLAPQLQSLNLSVKTDSSLVTLRQTGLTLKHKESLTSFHPNESLNQELLKQLQKIFSCLITHLCPSGSDLFDLGMIRRNSTHEESFISCQHI